MDNLRKQHAIVVDWCCMCKRCGESVDHLFLHYEIASALWRAIFNRAGLPWVMPKIVVDLLACWRGLSGNPQIAVMWKVSFVVYLEGKKL
jgi:hypothetical protein